MVNTYTYNGLTWVDVESPTRDEIGELVRKYDLHPTIGDELISPISEPRVELHKNCVYLNLDIPSRTKQGHKGVIMKKEVDFVVGKDFIITTKYDTVEPLHNFSRIFETNSILDKKGIGEHAGFIFYYMIKKLYAHVGRDLSNIRDDMSHAETRIFEGQERRMVVVLSNIGRELIDAQQILRTHAEAIELVGLAMEKFFSPTFRYYTDDITADYKKVSEQSKNLHELLRELRETNNLLLTTKQNETMKNLTLMAFVTFPLSLITDVFSMNTSHAPIVGLPYDFEIIVGVMLVLTLCMFGFFRWKKWL
ncbi:MAG: Mg2 transporter protein CorA family protein magnesium transporter [Candidatus Taylorbacteria bacterium]|nr:Mg2 transporter protein CorA family protein magnesium transporter [Candidatus Taylorbacteria bacterium]